MIRLKMVSRVEWGAYRSAPKDMKHNLERRPIT